MSTEPFLGEIKIFAFDFSPKGHVPCDGRIMSISQNTALFALLGTTYGGDAVTTFGIPDLRGRVPLNQGQSPGLKFFSIGERSGSASVTLLSNNLPAHMHTLNNTRVTLNANNSTADEQSPSGNHFAFAAEAIYTGNGVTAGSNIQGLQLSGTTDPTGSNAPLNIQNPYLVVNYSIATVGIFPPRP
ncbi:MAG: phage tail protein [Flavobacterium sp.]